jgi:anti-sigma B factor antagonist
VQPLLLQPHSADPFVVLKASGELDLHTQDEFEREVARLLGISAVVVDLSGLDFLAVAALRSLMVCHRQAATAGHELFYAEPSSQTLRLLTLSGLDAVLPVAASVAQVVDASASVNGADGSARAAAAIADRAADHAADRAADRAAGGFVDQSSRNFAQLDIR